MKSKNKNTHKQRSNVFETFRMFTLRKAVDGCWALSRREGNDKLCQQKWPVTANNNIVFCVPSGEDRDHSE